MVFQCANCKETFEKDGLNLIIHGVSVCRLCSSCIVTDHHLNLLVAKDAPGHPFAFALLQLDGDASLRSKPWKEKKQKS